MNVAEVFRFAFSQFKWTVPEQYLTWDKVRNLIVSCNIDIMSNWGDFFEQQSNGRGFF